MSQCGTEHEVVWCTRFNKMKGEMRGRSKSGAMMNVNGSTVF